jgi:hypothetical protein
MLQKILGPMNTSLKDSAHHFLKDLKTSKTYLAPRKVTCTRKEGKGVSARGRRGGQYSPVKSSNISTTKTARNQMH